MEWNRSDISDRNRKRGRRDGVRREVPKQPADLKQRGTYAIYPWPGYPLSPFHEDARMTMIALCDFRGDKLQQTGFAPCLINGENQAVPVASSNADFHRVKAYVEQIGETAGLRTRYEQGRIRGIDCILIKG